MDQSAMLTRAAARSCSMSSLVWKGNSGHEHGHPLKKFPRSGQYQYPPLHFRHRTYIRRRAILPHRGFIDMLLKGFGGKGHPDLLCFYRQETARISGAKNIAILIRISFLTVEV